MFFFFFFFFFDVCYLLLLHVNSLHVLVCIFALLKDRSFKALILDYLMHYIPGTFGIDVSTLLLLLLLL